MDVPAEYFHQAVVIDGVEILGNITFDKPARACPPELAFGKGGMTPSCWSEPV